MTQECGNNYSYNISCLFLNYSEIFLFDFYKKDYIYHLIVCNLAIRFKHVNKCKALKIMPDTENAQKF